MPPPIIEASHLAKCYRLGAIGATSLKESLTGWWSRRRDGKKPDDNREFWALRDVSFEVGPGEVVGIIGRNGAGKSTLLKILSRITDPTSGRAVMRGRAASLLEVGTGFHPDLTGRENVFLNGAILGMTKEEIRRKFDEIVAFAEVEQFIDTPVKRYSSGMYVRLAFAVAAHLEPEILIVDEVLAVGDAQFQKKCLGKMSEVSKAGRTILFVSHNMAAILALCQRAILLEKGRTVLDASVEEATSRYLSLQREACGSIEWNGPDQPASARVRFRKAFVKNEQGEIASRLDLRQGFVLGLEYEVLQATKDLIIGFDLHNAEALLICGSNNIAQAEGKVQEPGIYVTTCRFPGDLFNANSYQVRFIAHTTQDILLSTDLCLSFDMEDFLGHGSRFEKVHGIIRPRLSWEFHLLTVSQS
jgi:lipopolysaccharide transport system ATP-binding protein